MYRLATLLLICFGYVESQNGTEFCPHWPSCNVGLDFFKICMVLSHQLEPFTFEEKEYLFTTCADVVFAFTQDRKPEPRVLDVINMCAEWASQKLSDTTMGVYAPSPNKIVPLFSQCLEKSKNYV